MTDITQRLIDNVSEESDSLSSDLATNKKYEATAASDPTVGVDLKTIFLGGLLFLATLTICCVASEIILPVVLAFVLKLVLEPVMRVLQKFHIPRPVSALFIILLLFGSVIMMTVAISNPLADWGKRLSGSVSMLQERLSFLNQPLKEIHGVLQYADGLAVAPASTKPVTVTLRGSELSDQILTSTRYFITVCLKQLSCCFFC